jgi:hypothetical protein
MTTHVINNGCLEVSYALNWWTRIRLNDNIMQGQTNNTIYVSLALTQYLSKSLILTPSNTGFIQERHISLINK